MTTNNGLLLVDKPQGLTSHDVVAKVRRILGERRVGHAGTLDPMATGLLVLGVGPSTRLLRFAQSEVKRYSGAVLLGVATDSLDADGAVIGQAPVPTLSAHQMSTAAAAMCGTQYQTPPMVSAKKVGGTRLHELARQGIEVPREPREITVRVFDLTPSGDPAVWFFDVECTVGTYVRVLLSDFAQRIGTVGHLIELRRLSSGTHHVNDALTLRQIDEAVAAGSSPLRPPSHFVVHLERATLTVEQVTRMRRGQRLDIEQVVASDELAAFDGAGELVGILRRREGQWQPELVMASSGDTAHG